MSGLCREIAALLTELLTGLLHAPALGVVVLVFQDEVDQGVD